jgi:hypothetical protein
MSTLPTQIENSQRALCAEYRAEFVPAPNNTKVGFAISTKGLLPLNGLRHPVAGESNGWYIWCGASYSEAKDFFIPLHAFHLLEEYPELVPLLGLPPGYRFLKSGDYLDVWLDPSLLSV